MQCDLPLGFPSDQKERKKKRKHWLFFFFAACDDILFHAANPRKMRPLRFTAGLLLWNENTKLHLCWRFKVDGVSKLHQAPISNPPITTQPFTHRQTNSAASLLPTLRFDPSRHYWRNLILTKPDHSMLSENRISWNTVWFSSWLWPANIKW